MSASDAIAIQQMFVLPLAVLVGYAGSVDVGFRVESGAAERGVVPKSRRAQPSSINHLARQLAQFRTLHALQK
ncbi:hypothetical protein EX30DRAFT_340185 [Ascodesmis nigricans]|uniref:Uncharacterized protein n=1 Tax=Ascodesmis nigricans TaxID=341454 RepID=A0A4S2MZY4_9PEZI|nr:hypothetical protein EX30DRAFT_340185 [Ascodesmis nigricans]